MCRVGRRHKDLGLVRCVAMREGVQRRRCRWVREGRETVGGRALWKSVRRRRWRKGRRRSRDGEERCWRVSLCALLHCNVDERTDGRGRSVFSAAALDEPVPPKSIFARECLATLVTTERLDAQVDTLVALEIVVAVLTISIGRSICVMLLTKLCTHSSHLNGRSTRGSRFWNE